MAPDLRTLEKEVEIEAAAVAKKLKLEVHVVGLEAMKWRWGVASWLIGVVRWVSGTKLEVHVVSTLPGEAAPERVSPAP
jgi:hypothetical protein